MIEASLGVVGASLPTMRPIAKRYIPEGSFQKMKLRTSSTWSLFGRRRSSAHVQMSSGTDLESEKSAPEAHSAPAMPKLRRDLTAPAAPAGNACCDSRW